MYIYLVRHGFPDYELDVLRKDGREQAEKTSEFLKDENIDRFFVSPLGRAKETAKRTLEKVDKKATVIDWMSENYLAPKTMWKMPDGSFGWMFWIPEFMEKFKAHKDDPLWYEDEFFKKTQLKEATDLENKNVDEFLLSLGVEHDRSNNTFKKTRDDVPEKVCVFAHGGMAFAFLSSLLDKTYPNFASDHPCMDMCGISIIEINFDKKPGSREAAYNLVKY